MVDKASQRMAAAVKQLQVHQCPLLTAAAVCRRRYADTITAITGGKKSFGSNIAASPAPPPFLTALGPF